LTIDFFVVSLQKICKKMETKICNKCQEVKTLSEFGKNKGKILNRCKKCTRLSSKEWYENNKEKAKQYKKEWHENNKGKVKQRNKEWYENNKEKAIQYQKERYENNKEKIKQQHKEWRENNKEKIKQNQKEWRENNKEKLKYYNKKTRENCYPSYITSKLKKQGFNKEQITPELIEEKTNIIKVKRIIKKINESIN
jgi:hypothetical protein